MATYQIGWFWLDFAGRDGGVRTLDINIPPAWVGVEVNLYGTSGVGAFLTGIKQYRRRLSSGADEDHIFEVPWPPVIFDYISSVTLAIGLGINLDFRTRVDPKAWIVARMDYWG